MRPTKYKQYCHGRQPPSEALLQAAHDLFAPVAPRESAPAVLSDLDHFAAEASSRSLEPRILASEWTPMVKGTRIGFVDLTLPCGIKIRDVALCQSHGKRWITFPARPQIDASGELRKVGGKTQYLPVIEIVDEDERAAFQKAALAAVDQLIGNTTLN